MPKFVQRKICLFEPNRELPQLYTVSRHPAQGEIHRVQPEASGASLYTQSDPIEQRSSNVIQFAKRNKHDELDVSRRLGENKRGHAYIYATCFLAALAKCAACSKKGVCGGGMSAQRLGVRTP